MDNTVTTQFRARPGAWQPEQSAAWAEDALRKALRSTVRRGAVVGVSGGVDSATCAYLAATACPGRLILVHIPDRASDSHSLQLAAKIAGQLGLPLHERRITQALDGLKVDEDLTGCVSEVLEQPRQYIDAWKLVRTDARTETPVRWRITAWLTNGRECHSRPLIPRQLMYIVSRMNHKQRMRMSVLFSLAEEHSYMVVGTANRTELSTGFFVRNGDGAGDVFPLAHLFKTEVRQLAAEVKVPPEIVGRVSTSDTFTAFQTQQEFFFGMSAYDFDMTLFGFEAGLSAGAVASDLGIDAHAVAAVYADLRRRGPHLRWLRHQPDLERSSQ